MTMLDKVRNSVSRRGFLGALGLGGVALTLPGGARARAKVEVDILPLDAAPKAGLIGPFTLPDLPYGYDALEPYIDTMTMMLHHDRHHATYVKELNDALAPFPDLATKNVVDLLTNLDSLPASIQTFVRNNGGGHVNHSIFWPTMTGNSSRRPTGTLLTALEGTFGSFDSFKGQFNFVSTRRFGSGWGWLVLDKARKLSIISTPNQDSPYMMGLIPIFGIDVWEHAYYLRYNNRRAEYLDRWWNVANWTAIQQRYEEGVVSVSRRS